MMKGSVGAKFDAAEENATYLPSADMLGVCEMLSPWVPSLATDIHFVVSIIKH